MFVSIRRYTMGAGSIDALARRLEDEFARALSQEPGFLGYLALDTGHGTVESVSVFADAESAHRSDELAAAYVAEELAEYELTLTDRSAGDAMVSRLAPDVLEGARRWRTGRARRRRAAGPPPVLVVGATGRTGRGIVERLVEQHVPVRALVRDAARARALLPRGAAVVVGDLRDPDSLAGTMEGVGTVVVASCGSAERDNSAVMVDYFGTRYLMQEALAAGVGDVLFVSSIYATRPDHYLDVEPTSLGWKARGEEVVRASGIPYCIVRAGWLTDGPGGEALALSQGDTGEGHLSRADLAAVCARVLTLDDARGKTFEVVAGHGEERPPLEEAIAGLRRDAGAAAAVVS